jgi:DNA invertase Pin-like site-specific DNA recombinase
MRCVVYARYSSDKQNPGSIDDQLAACRARAEREGWTIVREYSDAELSGFAMQNRPGIIAMMQAAQSEGFNIVLCESLDRLSRSQAHIAALYESLQFLDMRIMTLAEGEISELHVGLKGTMNALFLKDLAQKTRRGLVGRHSAGQSTGGRTYGYRTGEDGALESVPEEVEIVRRIFREYLASNSPLTIVTALNREGVPGPSGGTWSASTLNGSRARANGILCNRAYIGEFLYGRQRNVKDPATGKQQKRLVPRRDWLAKILPELAIVDREVFDAAQIRRATASQVRLGKRRRPQYVLSGLVVCSSCGGTMAIARANRLACSSRTNKGTCDNNRTIAVAEVEQRVLVALKSRLLAPEAVARAVEAYRSERARRSAERRQAERTHARDLGEVERKIARLVSAIESGEDEVPALRRRLGDLETERIRIMAAAPAELPDDLLALHPKASASYRRTYATRSRRAMGQGPKAWRWCASSSSASPSLRIQSATNWS